MHRVRKPGPALTKQGQIAPLVGVALGDRTASPCNIMVTRTLLQKS